MPWQILLAWLPWVLLIIIAGMAAVTDWRARRISNRLALAGLLAGLLLGAARGGWGEFSLSGLLGAEPSLLNSAAGAWLLFLLFFAAYLSGGLGAGDAKLAAALGALGGGLFAWWSLLPIAFTGAGLAALYLILYPEYRAELKLRRQAKKAPGKPAANQTEPAAGGNKPAPPATIPYAVAFAIGAGWTIYLLWQARSLPGITD